MGNAFFLTPVSEPVDVHSGYAGDDQAYGHDADPQTDSPTTLQSGCQANHLLLKLEFV